MSKLDDLKEELVELSKDIAIAESKRDEVFEILKKDYKIDGYEKAGKRTKEIKKEVDALRIKKDRLVDQATELMEDY